MKIESTTFTPADVQGFMDEFLDHERELLADRLEEASARLAELGPRITSGHGDGEWSSHEVLAHIAVLSKFYGVLVHKISSGQMTELNLLENVNVRDVAGEQMAKVEPAELLRMAQADHRRSIETLRAVEPRNLRRAARLEDGTMMTAEEIARLPLVTHLELHIEQLERSLES
jgi:tetrahydrodipicolinate N-succinyltransferase